MLCSSTSLILLFWCINLKLLFHGTPLFQVVHYAKIELLLLLRFVKTYPLFSFLFFTFDILFVTFLIRILVTLIHEYFQCKTKSFQKEILDVQGTYTQQELVENIQDIALINQITGAQYALETFVPTTTQSILDVGCGSGIVCRDLSKHVGNDCIIKGIDINEKSIVFAKEQSQQHKNISFECTPLESIPSNSYEIVTNSLVMHHLPSSNDAKHLIQESIRCASKYVIINDLERSCVNICLFEYLLKPLFSNRLTRHDGLLSIRRSWSQSDWMHTLLQGYQYTMHWRLGRFIIVIQKKNATS